MLIVVSPAKKLDWSERKHALTEPPFPGDSAELIRVMREKSVSEISKLMDLSENLSKLNHDRYRDYREDPTPDVLRPAMFAFAGDTYQGLDAQSLDAEEVAFAQDHLRILSGLYGVLRPLDGMQPYRLEMGTRLKTDRGSNLYQFWGDKIAGALKAQAETLGTDTLLNCASQEYFGAVDRKALGLKIVTPVFLDVKNGAEKVISFNAKRARGAMARFAITRRITDPAGLADFDLGGYHFQPGRSSVTELVFLRNAEAVAA
ncbi:peroxide stress protein YaaA [Oceanicola sp. S124]|uniref:peroxide stress protein YaaA n=1 Tax=Oceanicola sp. S124 TaxID=1042378 RepID=UPI0002558D51|nr:peroxide stress protein YaaA [Oceanicola sp. S124]